MRPTWLALAILAPLVRSVAVGGQEPMSLDSLILAHRTPLEFVDGKAQGPGMDLLVDAASSAQFVMVAESHNLAQVPIFTGDLFERLSEYGFEYLVMENGPYAVEGLMTPGVRGDSAAAFRMANSYKNGLQFWNDQEIDLISRVGARSTSAYDAVWGVDQAWGTLHILEAIREYAPSPEAGDVIDELITEARQYESVRPDRIGEGDLAHPRFLTQVLRPEQLAGLEDAFENAGREADRLLSILRTSYDIYAARDGADSYYTANNRREQYMRRQFMEHYRRATSAGSVVPRAVLKFGQWHAMAGTLNWGFVRPFGTFLSEFATSNGMGYLGVWTSLVNEPGHVWTPSDFEDYRALANAGTTDRWWVVDLRPIRHYVAGGLVGEINNELEKVFFGFDFALLIGSGDRATRDRLDEGN